MKQEIEKKRCDPGDFQSESRTRIKTGNKTDYVSRQYLGSIGKVDSGIVSVNVYGIYENITFPLMTKIFKPEGTLKKNDFDKTKTKLASEIIKYLKNFGLKISLVLADSL